MLTQHEEKLKDLNGRLYRLKKQFEKTKNPQIMQVIKGILSQIRGVKEDIILRREPTQRKKHEF